MRSQTRISFITTVYNEEKTIVRFLDSLFSQSQLPDEIIIVDGGSTDETLRRIRNYELRIKEKKINLILVSKKGNRSVGRNEAIKHATGDIIVCSDAGNILDKHWLEQIIMPFGNKKVDVVAGYYRGKAKSIFQKCLIPYVLVMPDQVDPKYFLPATRSIAFTKKVWKKVGKFDERYSHNEDYVFANRLKKIGANIVFAPKAIVHWIPRNSFKEAFIMFYRFALGDAESGIWRTKVLLLFARYFIGLYLLALCLLYQSLIGFGIIGAFFIGYLLWSIIKNYRYVEDKRAWFFLPALQITADISVLCGTIAGVIKRVISFNYLSFFKQNKFFVFICFVYTSILLLTIQWGIPNQEHPFPYHMDEWHQLQAVGNTFRYGTPNTFGSANGTMFHFLYSGLYLAPFSVLQLVDPFSLQIDNLIMREKMFIILRLQTILFGLFSLFVLVKIAQLLHISKKIVLFFFTITPSWLLFSGYFKYDIALIFWILLSLYYLFRFAIEPTRRNYLIAAIPASIAIAVKVSAAPLALLYLCAYVIFMPSWRKNINTILLGIATFIFTLLIFGFPDTLFGRGNVVFYLYENIIQTPATTTNFIFGMHPLHYLFLKHYPVIFGYGLMFLFIISFVIFFSILFIKRSVEQKIAFFILLSFLLFLISIIPLQIYGGGNRSLVLLPFFVLIIGFAWKKIKMTKVRRAFLACFILAGILQLYTSTIWMYLKIVPSPQEVSSHWVEKNISKGATIGLENIPIYQNVPHIVQKEFYFAEYHVAKENLYQYKIVDSQTSKLPDFVIITGGDIEQKVVKESPKKSLIDRLQKEGYKKAYTYSSEEVKFLPLMSDRDYYFSWMGLPPQTITIYTR